MFSSYLGSELATLEETGQEPKPMSAKVAGKQPEKIHRDPQRLNEQPDISFSVLTTASFEDRDTAKGNSQKARPPLTGNLSQDTGRLTVPSLSGRGSKALTSHSKPTPLAQSGQRRRQVSTPSSMLFREEPIEFEEHGREDNDVSARQTSSFEQRSAQPTPKAANVSFQKRPAAGRFDAQLPRAERKR